MMDGFNRTHPDGGYGLGRHAPMPAPQQSAQQLAQGTPGATAATPAAAAPTPPPGPAERAQHLLSQRRPQPAAQAPAPSLAAPPPAAPVPAPLPAPPPAAPASSPLAAPAPQATPNQWGVDFSKPFTAQTRPAGWNDTMERLSNPAMAGNEAAWAADPRSNPNNTMGVFYDPSKKAGDVTGYYNDFLKPELRAGQGQQVSLQQAGITPGSAGDPTWNPSGVIAAAAKARQ